MALPPPNTWTPALDRGAKGSKKRENANASREAMGRVCRDESMDGTLWCHAAACWGVGVARETALQHGSIDRTGNYLSKSNDYFVHRFFEG